MLTCQIWMPVNPWVLIKYPAIVKIFSEGGDVDLFFVVGLVIDVDGIVVVILPLINISWNTDDPLHSLSPDGPISLRHQEEKRKHTK